MMLAARAVLFIVLVPSRWQVVGCVVSRGRRMFMPMMSVAMMRAVRIWLTFRNFARCELAAASRAFEYREKLLCIATAQRRSENRRKAEVGDDSNFQHVPKHLAKTSV